MRIAIAHNRYQQAGGEDTVVAAESAMLRAYGHEVEEILFDNEAIAGSRAKAAAAVSAFYSAKAHRRVATVLKKLRPHVLHVHNFQPTMSPSVFFAAAAAAVPVVQTLHNYRLICANAQLFRAGRVCEQCVEARSMTPGVLHGCYRNSRLGSAVIGGTNALHGRLGTWEQRIARYIALSHFAKAKLGEFRLPAHKIRVKPNFVPDAGTGSGDGGYALFVGRLSAEKGLQVLLAADRLGRFASPVWIAGEGPLRGEVEQACAQPGSRLVYCGPQTADGVRQLMKQAVALLVPSLWYEGFPMVLVEALSLGLPVIASRLGSLPEIIEEGVCGLLHAAGSAEAMADALRTFLAQPPTDRLRMRASARLRYLEHYGEQANYNTLMGIYCEALASRECSEPLVGVRRATIVGL